MIEQVETALIGALETACPQYAVDRAKSLRRYQFTHPKAAIVPVLQDETWERGPTAAQSFRPARPQFSIMSITHGLYADPGAYEVLGAVKSAVEGLQIAETDEHPGGTMRIQSRFFDREMKGGGLIYVTQVQLIRE